LKVNRGSATNRKNSFHFINYKISGSRDTIYRSNRHPSIFLPTFRECQCTPIKLARNAGKHYTDNFFKLGAEETSKMPVKWN